MLMLALAVVNPANVEKVITKDTALILPAAILTAQG